MTFLTELRRRNVHKVAIGYLAVGWLLTEIIGTAVPAIGAPEWIGHLVLLLFLLGLPFALWFSWAFELTDDGLKRSHEVDPDASITDRTGRTIDFMIIGVLVVAVGWLLHDKFLGERALESAPAASVDADGRASIAVLPFVNMSGNPENEYFSDGLTETLLHMLAQVQDLRVAARTSAFAFKDTNIDVREIATQLNVSTILEGSVQRAGQRVRITAQLIDAADGSHIWSQNYDRDLDDIFAIQDEIANAVADALTASLLGEAAAAEVDGRPGHTIASLGTQSTEAYDAYLRGLAPLATRSHASMPLAEQAFKEALLIDPGFREARLALVMTYREMGYTALIPMSEAIPLARNALAPLLETAADDPMVSALDAFLDATELLFTGVPEDEQLIALADRIAASVARAPNELDLYRMLAQVLAQTDDRGDQALEFIERAITLDPLDADLHFQRATLLMFDGDQEELRDQEALAALTRARDLEPGNPNYHAFPGLLHLQRGEYDQSLPWLLDATRVDRQDHELSAFVAITLQELGMVDEAAPWVARAQLQDAEGGATRVAELRQLVLSDETTQALALAEQILREQRSNRRNMYEFAGRVYTTLMLEQGQAAEALAFYEAIHPGITHDLDYAGGELYRGIVRRRIMPLRLAVFEGEERAAYLAELEGSLDGLAERFDFDWRDDDDWAPVRYLHGFATLEEAAPGLAREIRDEHQLRLDDRLYYRTPALGPLMEHPSVAAAVAAEQARIAAQRERVRASMASGELAGL